MQMFLDPHCGRIARVFGGNPLLRRTDRIEAVVMLVALLAFLAAIPIAGVVGFVTYGARDRVYVQEAHERHRVVATVAETWAGDLGVTIVQAKWPAPAGERVGTLQLAGRVKAGDSAQIWVDNDGKPVVPPTPTWLAVGEGVGTTAVALLAVGVGMVALVATVRSRLDRIRDAAWERDLRCLAEAS